MVIEKNNPLVSVIIPFFKRYDFLTRAVDSVVSQTYENVEILLINDGTPNSDDFVVELSKKYKNIRYFRLEENVGPSGARNYGIEKAKGEYVAFLDSDDRWEKNKLSIQIHFMEKNDWGFSHTSYWRHNTEKGKKIKINSGRSLNIFPLIAFHCPIVTPSVVIKKKHLEDNKFNINLRIGEDVLLWINIAKDTKIHGINQPLTHVYVGHQDHVKDKSIKEYGLSVIGKEAFSNNAFLYLSHKCYRILRLITNKLCCFKNNELY